MQEAEGEHIGAGWGACECVYVKEGREMYGGSDNGCCLLESLWIHV